MICTPKSLTASKVRTKSVMVSFFVTLFVRTRETGWGLRSQALAHVAYSHGGVARISEIELSFFSFLLSNLELVPEQGPSWREANLHQR